MNGVRAASGNILLIVRFFMVRDGIVIMGCTSAEWFWEEMYERRPDDCKVAISPWLLRIFEEWQSLCSKEVSNNSNGGGIRSTGKMKIRSKSLCSD